jgi:hypothetical protein
MQASKRDLSATPIYPKSRQARKDDHLDIWYPARRNGWMDDG